MTMLHAMIPSALPAANPEGELAAEPARCAALNVLLIDDDEAVAQGLAKLLKRHGFDVVVARQGAEGLRLTRNQPVHLVITDIYMDQMDGLETIIQLQREHPQVPIIAISGGSPRVPVNCLVMARSLGARAVMEKPVRIDELMKVIRELGFMPATASA